MTVRRTSGEFRSFWGAVGLGKAHGPQLGVLVRGRTRADENGGTVFCLHALAFAQPCEKGIKGIATLLVTDPLRGNSELLFCGEETVRPTGYADS
jgi:hypothetical protein